MVALKGTAAIKAVDSRDLLEMLTQHPLTAPFNLALYSERQGRGGLLESIRSVCAPLDGKISCIADCYQSWEEQISRALLANQPVVSSCTEGFLHFVIPVPDGKGLPPLRARHLV